MFRIVHRWPGLLAALLLIVLSLSGAALSIFPAFESASSLQVEATLSSADLAARVRRLSAGGADPAGAFRPDYRLLVR